MAINYDVEYPKLQGCVAELQADRRLARQYVANLEADLRKTKAKLEAIRKLPSREFNARRFPYSSLGAWVRVKDIERILQEQENE